MGGDRGQRPEHFVTVPGDAGGASTWGSPPADELAGGQPINGEALARGLPLVGELTGLQPLHPDAITPEPGRPPLWRGG